MREIEFKACFSCECAIFRLILLFIFLLLPSIKRCRLFANYFYVRAREMESSKVKSKNKIQIQFKTKIKIKIKNPNQLGEPKASLEFCFNFCRALCLLFLNIYFLPFCRTHIFVFNKQIVVLCGYPPLPSPPQSTCNFNLLWSSS